MMSTLISSWPMKVEVLRRWWCCECCTRPDWMTWFTAVSHLFPPKHRAPRQFPEPCCLRTPGKLPSFLRICFLIAADCYRLQPAPVSRAF